MSVRILLVISVISLVAGCQVLGNIDPGAGPQPVRSLGLCIFADHDLEPQKNCDLEFWLKYWSEVNAIPWPERLAQIEGLSDAPADLLRKVLLCQGTGTPYQNRLRAQGWIISLIPILNEDMQQFVIAVIYQPSQELLELESALVTLSKISTNQANRVEEQKLLLDQQKHQIEQLLKIEASIMDKTKGTKP